MTRALLVSLLLFGPALGPSPVGGSMRSQTAPQSAAAPSASDARRITMQGSPLVCRRVDASTSDT